jgi:predicted dehydrogenase
VAKYRVGMIATGSIARSQARGWQGVPDVEMVALADTSGEARRAFGDEFGISMRYADYREMLDKEKLDIVSICSWHPQHAEMTLAAAARQPQAILCEKPMATCLGEADEMIVACERNDVKLAIGHQRRFYTGWGEARRLVQSGAIGEPQRLWCVGFQGLLNFSTHLIDWMRWVLGEPRTEWVIGNAERKTDRYERAMRIEDSCVGLIGFEGGIQAVIENDITFKPVLGGTVYGSEGMVFVEDNTARYMNGTTKGWVDVENEDNDPFVGQAQGVVDWVEGRISDEEFRLEAQKGRAAIEIMMAIFESARLHEIVRMPLETRVLPLDLMVESGHLPVERPGRYDIRSFLVRGEVMSWI